MYKKILLCFITTISLFASGDVIKKENITSESKETNKILMPTNNNASGCEESEERIQFLSKDENLFTDVVIEACEK